MDLAAGADLGVEHHGLVGQVMVPEHFLVAHRRGHLPMIASPGTAAPALRWCGRWALMLRTGWAVVRRVVRVSSPARSMVTVSAATWTVTIWPAWMRPRAIFWAGLSQVHVLPGGHRIKTLPSRPGARGLARLAAAGAQPAGPPPLPPASGDVTEVDRTANASGNVSLGDRIVSAGSPLAGQRATLRPEGPVAHVPAGGARVRAVVCPIPEAPRPRLRGARPGTGSSDIRRHKASSCDLPQHPG
jgi:hypothetical protein